MSSLAAIYSSVVLFFPLWMQIWEKEPIAGSYLSSQGHYETTREALDKIREGLPFCNADLRSRLMQELSDAPIPANQSLMLEWLGTEKEAEVQMSLLQLLQKMDLTQLPAQLIRPFLTSPDIRTAEAAIQLYGQLPQADFQELLPFLPADQEPVNPLRLRKAAWRVFSRNPDAAAVLGSRILDYQQESVLEIQALALQAACLLQTRLPEVSAWLDQAAEGSALLRLAAAKDPFPENAARLQTLLQDSEPGIRIAACQANPGTHQELLLAALKDRDQAVRLAALIALRQQTDLNNLKAVDCLLNLFADPLQQIRLEAENSLVFAAEQNSGPAKERLLQTLSSDNALRRLHAMLALTRLNQRNAVAIIAKQIPQESTSENLSAGILALAALAPLDSYGDLLQQYVEHPSPLVRSAVAKAVGNLHPSGCEPILQKLCLDKQSPAVRVEAFAAMGYFPQGIFATSLLTCLKNTGATTSEERRNAAWAAGKLQPANQEQHAELQELAKRLVIQCTKPVIPGMEPMFEAIDVIGNAMYSLVQLQKRFPKQKIYADNAQIVLQIYEVPWKEAQQIIPQGRNMPAPVDAISNSLASQARQWLKDEPITTTEIPSSTLSFSYSSQL